MNSAAQTDIPMSALTPHHHWIVPAPHPVSEAAIADARRRGLSARALRVLSRRGPVEPADLAARFDPPERGLHDPALLPDAAVVVERIERAVAARERVLVLGDFDADGLCGLTILAEALAWMGLQVDRYVPDRSTEGHGLSLAAVARAQEAGDRLILTADTGTSSGAEVEAARAAGIDVIVTDHHVLPPEPARPLALVNPQRPDNRYPDVRLSGAGVAFKVAQLLLRTRPGGPEAALELVDLAAIGSVADVVPLAGENRCLVRLGLARLAQGSRPGLASLLARARLAGAAPTVDDIAFRLGPRINAMGRVGDPSVAAALLGARDAAEAERLAGEIESANSLRRQWMLAALEEARAVLDGQPGTTDAPFVVVAGDWPVGVIGLVAGRLAEELGRPTLVVSSQVDPWRGSARSAGGFDLAGAFDKCADLLVRHGGHPAAAGCHVEAGRFGALAERLVALAVDHPPRDRRPSLTLDLVQSGDAADHVLLRELARLEDAAEAPPLVGFAGLVVARVRLASGGHTQLTLRKGRDVVDGIGFGRADLADTLAEGMVIDVVAHLGSRTFAGLETLQLEIRDVAPAGHLAGMRAPSMAASQALATTVAAGPVALAG
jgi:single-stranded-DNA-specific exonuclease